MPFATSTPTDSKKAVRAVLFLNFSKCNFANSARENEFDMCDRLSCCGGQLRSECEASVNLKTIRQMLYTRFFPSNADSNTPQLVSGCFALK
jgi:hypothetical protein